MFVNKLSDSDGEATETQVWLKFSKECSYLSVENYRKLTREYEEVGRMLDGMILHPEKFAPR